MAKAEPRSITRRSLVAALALPLIPALPSAATSALPAPSLSAAAPTPDPVFAMIEAHVRAFRAFNTVLDVLAVAETQAWHAPRGQRRAANKRLKQARADESHFGNEESDAVARLVATVPQTLHGAAAVLAYVREHFEQGYPMCGEEEETIALLASIECAVCRAAGLPAPPCPARDTVT
jgi:hypothetical protein